MEHQHDPKDHNHNHDHGGIWQKNGALFCHFKRCLFLNRIDFGQSTGGNTMGFTGLLYFGLFFGGYFTLLEAIDKIRKGNLK